MKRKRPGRLGFGVTAARRAVAPGRLSPAFRAPGATRLPAAVPDLKLTVARQNVALGQEEQHAGQEADRPQRLRRSLHLAGARAHFRASRRDWGGVRRRGRGRAWPAGALLLGSACGHCPVPALKLGSQRLEVARS